MQPKFRSVAFLKYFTKLKVTVLWSTKLQSDCESWVAKAVVDGGSIRYSLISRTEYCDMLSRSQPTERGNSPNQKKMSLAVSGSDFALSTITIGLCSMCD